MQSILNSGRAGDSDMKKNILYLLFLFVLPMWMCRKETACDCFKGTGEVITETRQLPVFTSVYVEDNVNLIFQEDTVQKVEVKAGKHLIKNILTEVIENELKIKNINKCNFVRRYDIPIEIYIHYVRNQIYQIRTKGTGKITNSNPCTSDSIDLNSESSGDIFFTMGGSSRAFTHQHGAGDITLTGSCAEVIIYSKGTGFTITDECNNNYCWVYTNTTGKITVTTTGSLISRIEGSGNVYYTGTPSSINNTSTSTGTLLPLH
ncbi:hypothetical protein BH09BAC5_BH09BAC5_20920 [soil metagenome]